MDDMYWLNEFDDEEVEQGYIDEQRELDDLDSEDKEDDPQDHPSLSDAERNDFFRDPPFRPNY